MTLLAQTLANLYLKIYTIFVIKYLALVNNLKKMIQKISKKIHAECHACALLLILLKEIGVKQN